MRNSPFLRGLIGFIAGMALWYFAAPVYHPLVALASETTLNVFEHPNVTRLEPLGRNVLLHRTDFDPRSPRPELPMGDLTFNVILLVTLLAASGPPMTPRGSGRWVAALGTLFVVHVAALVTKIMSLYVARMGAWSLAHYGPISREFWGGLNHFYRLIGIFAAAIVIWWIARDPGVLLEGSSRKRFVHPRRPR